MSRALVPVAVLVAALALVAAGCGGDDEGGAGGVPDAGAGADAAAACILPADAVTCTDDAPCADFCAGAYCREFGMLGQSVCTQNCSTIDDCPDGWSCNMMVRCRPPG